MKAETEAFRNRIRSLAFDELVEFTVSEHERYMELKIRDEENQRISTEMHIQYSRISDENRSLKEDNATLKELLRKEVEKNKLKTRTTYGRSTEKLLSLINSAANKPEDFVDENQEEEDGEKESRIISFPESSNSSEGADSGKKGIGTDGGKKSPRKSSLKKSIENLPREILYLLDIPALNAAYGEGNWRIAFWREHVSVEKIPVSYYARYTLTPVISSGLEHELYTVPYYNLLLPHTYASASIIADILYRKFVLSLPFYRQAVDYQMSGIELSKQVIIHWVNAIVPEFFERIRSYMTQYLIRSGYIQSDESYFLVNKDGRGPGHKSFMWVHCTSEMLDGHPVIVFYYEATRGTEHLRQLFGEFLGYMICDAYISYQVMEKENPLITVAGCLMHCRRYFAEALFVNDISSMTDDEINELLETKALLLLREIYIAENALRDMSSDERHKERQTSVKPKVNAFFEYVHSLSDSETVLSERLNKAVQYAINQESKLREFLNDGNIPCDNARSEQVIRAYSIGRANWLFADTITGANVNAIMYSIVETAKANKADVRIYIQYLLENISKAIDNGSADSTDFLESMMPWSQEYREYEEKTRQIAMNSFKNLFREPVKPRAPLRRNQGTSSRQDQLDNTA